MKKSRDTLLLVITVVISLVSLSYCSKHATQDTMMINHARSPRDIAKLFAVDTQAIQHNLKTYLNDAQRCFDAIIALSDNDRTFANTAQALDNVLSLSNLAISQHIFHALDMLSPDAQVRHAAHEAAIEIQKFWDENIKSNKKLYDAFMGYVSQQKENEQLSDQQRYFLNDIMKLFKMEGLNLSDEQLELVKNVRNELSVLTSKFDSTIAQDNRTITVDRSELAGLDDDFVDALRKDDNGKYIVGVDYPTYYYVMENCANADTRKKLTPTTLIY